MDILTILPAGSNIPMCELLEPRMLQSEEIVSSQTLHFILASVIQRDLHRRVAGDDIRSQMGVVKSDRDVSASQTGTRRQRADKTGDITS